jgi:S1-C subfamily serine protease
VKREHGVCDLFMRALTPRAAGACRFPWNPPSAIISAVAEFIREMSVKARLPRLVCWVLLALWGAGSAHAQTAQEIAQRSFRSTVLLVMEDASGQPLSLGSGFLVRDGEIATNLHVIEGAVTGYAKLIGEKTKYSVEGITAVDPKRDLVILKVSVGHSQSLPLGDSDAVQVGESVYAVGNPQGLEGTFSQGIVSSIRDVGTDKLLQVTAPISPGSSGGPVLNEKGEVIAVSVATFRGGQNLNFAIPSNYLRTLLATAGPAKPLTQAKGTKPQRSILADLGGRSTEGVVGGQLTWDNPYFEAGDYAISLHNQLRQNVKNVYCLVVFFDSHDNPIDVDGVQYGGLIPAGLAKRVTGRVDGSVQRLTHKVVYRVLNFEIV